MTTIQATSNVFLQRAAEDHLDLYFNDRKDLFGKDANARKSLTSITKKKLETLGCTWTTGHEKRLFGFYRQYAFRRIHAEYAFTRKRTLVKESPQEKTVEVISTLTVIPLKGKALAKHLEATVDWMDIAILMDFSTENIFDAQRPNHDKAIDKSLDEVLDEALEPLVSSESDDEGDPILQQAAPQILEWSIRSFKRLVEQNRLTGLLEFMTNPNTWTTTPKRKVASSAIEDSSSPKKSNKRRRIQVALDILQKSQKITEMYKLPPVVSNLLGVEAHFTRMKLDIFDFLRVSWGLAPPGMQKTHDPKRVIAVAKARLKTLLFPVNVRMNSIAFAINQLSSLHEYVLYSLHLGPSVDVQKLIHHLTRKMGQLSQRDLANIRPITDMYLLKLSALYHRETYEVYLRMKRRGLTARLLPLLPMFCQSSLPSCRGS